MMNCDDSKGKILYRHQHSSTDASQVDPSTACLLSTILSKNIEIIINSDTRNEILSIEIHTSI